MNERGTDQPRHERGIFDRIPEPPAAPAEFVIGPPRAQRDAAGQERPGGQRPGLGPADPLAFDAAAEQAGNGEGKSNCEADVAHVQQRRVEDHARVLQQRVEIVAVRRAGQDPGERIGRKRSEREKADRDDAHDGQHAGAKYLGQRSRQCHDGNHPAAQHQHPQQQGAFVAAPYRAEPVVPRQQQVGIACDVFDREVVHQKARGQHGEGKQREHEQAYGQRRRGCNQAVVADPGAD